MSPSLVRACPVLVMLALMGCASNTDRRSISPDANACSTPRAYFETEKAALARRDGRVLWALQSERAQKRMREVFASSIEEAKLNPAKADELRRVENLGRDPRTMTPDELAIAVIPSELQRSQGSEAPALVDVTESGDEATLSIEWTDTKGEHRRVNEFLVREAGQWRAK